MKKLLSYWPFLILVAVMALAGWATIRMTLYSYAVVQRGDGKYTYMLSSGWISSWEVFDTCAEAKAARDAWKNRKLESRQSDTNTYRRVTCD